MENRKIELLQFISYVSQNQLVGIYYLDKTLNIPHYTIYSYENLNELRDKIKSFGDSLEDDLIKILMWKINESKEYLTGVYDGIMNDYKNDGEQQLC